MKRWRASKNYFWEGTPFFRLLLPLVLVIICYDKHLLPAISNSLLLPALTVTLLIAITTLLLKKASRGIDILRAICIYASISVATWFVCYKNDIRNQATWFGNHLDNEFYEARISEAPLERGKTWRLKVVVDRGYVQGRAIQTTGAAFVYVYKDCETIDLHKGDVIIIPNKWHVIKNSGNPHEFDYMRFCNRSNIFYQTFIDSNDILMPRQTIGPATIIDRVHNWAMLALDRYIDDRATAGLLQAMLLGDEVNFDRGMRQVYAETGIIHIVAISGGHVIVFFQIVSLLFFWLRNKKYEYLKYLFAIPLVCFYVVIAGAPVSAIRAAVMFSFMAFGLILQRDKQSLNQLFTTAFFMLIYEPMWLFNIGFQLSFAAVLSLILFYQPLYRSITVKNKTIKKIWGVVVASIAAEIVIAPLVIYYFHLLPVAFLFANIIAYLFMGGILVAGLILVMISSFAPIAVFLAVIINKVVAYFNMVIQLFQRLNPDSFRHLYLSLHELIIVYVIIGGLAAFAINRQRKGLFVGLIASCLLLCFLIYDKWSALNQNQFIAYNIGRKAHAEIILGCKYFPVVDDDSDGSVDFATKEQHIVSRAWKKGSFTPVDVMTVGGQKLIIFDRPIPADTVTRFNIDYLMLNYPVDAFEARGLQKVFHFKKLILGSSQKRYAAGKFKDSCDKYHVPVHLIASDGAFIIK